MPPKDRTKFVSKMNTEELLIVAKNLGINIDEAKTVPQMRAIISAASAGYSKKYDFSSIFEFHHRLRPDNLTNNFVYIEHLTLELFFLCLVL